MSPSLDLIPLLESFSIRDKAARIVPFKPNWAQTQVVRKVEEDYAVGKPTRLIILKARQLGISTITQGILLSMSLLFKNLNAAVVAHRSDAAEYLFSIGKTMFESWPYSGSFPVRYSTRRELSLETQGSAIKVHTADKPDVGRTVARTFLHASELAMWRLPIETMIGFASSIPDIPGTAIFVESTAKGVGNLFEEMWNDATAGISEYTPLFFPWFLHYEYIPCGGLGCEMGTCEICERESKGVKPRDTEEKRLVKLGATIAHIAWRRKALPTKFYGDEDYFRQEMPATPEEAFLSEGVNAFRPDLLKTCFDPISPQVGRLVRNKSTGGVDFVPDRQGPLRLYKRPSSQSDYGRYFIGADPCNGTADADFAAAQVINRHTKEQVAVWHARINPVPFADELAKLGQFFNWAIVAPDIMGGGAATLGALTHVYPNIWEHRNPAQWPGKDRSRSLGFLGSWQRKQWMVAKLADYIERDQIVIHDTATYKELRAYVFYGSKGWGDVFGPATRDGHDDLVASLAIAVLCESTEDPVRPYEVAEEPPNIISPLRPTGTDDEFEPFE